MLTELRYESKYYAFSSVFSLIFFLVLIVCRKYDYENYLTTLLLPEGCRAAAFVIRAFNIELAQVAILKLAQVAQLSLHR